MRRKRRSRGNWMPVLGHRVEDDNEVYHYADRRLGFQQPLATNATGPVTSLPIPIIPDFTVAESAATSELGASLHDRVTGNAWLLQRIVGKIHLSCTASGVTGTAAEIWNNIYVCAGLFVARAEDSNQGIADLDSFESEPQQVDNAANPWIWRRTWILGNPAGDGNRYPQFNTGMYGSVADGPHIDSKVKRFITREHRLWYVQSVRGYDPRVATTVSGDDGAQPLLGGTLDLRIFGSLRRAKNTSAF